ncbi:hypothetical protein ASD11_15040 [Aeromicrobium sp. Root495]|uniref:hypothetical protein n=1 Tax=Aeromicrobium sp. Root495 TaxID=1736550 RepID=UPI0006F894A3|nr:hypothetical protein [Aeromicrobium sp. Root495]KQY55817.1 hypothetical protein ASD11_15040 [Aeromicrobium sp. Root495]
MNDERHSVSSGDRLRDSKDKQVGIRWPIALDQRLDDLVERANNAGASTTRRETIAAILLVADHTGEELVEILISYRRALVRDALLEVSDADVIQFKAHRPGPRGSS